MKKPFAYTVALGLLIAVPAGAASDSNHHGDKHERAAPSETQHSKTRTILPHGVMSEPPSPADHLAEIVTIDMTPHLTKASPMPATARNVGSQRHPNHKSLGDDVQSPQHFRNGDYIGPQEYEPRIWSHGERLPRRYYARNYWIGDYLSFGLFAQPTGLVWTRVGNDALLVDRNNGDIVQAHYDVFY